MSHSHSEWLGTPQNDQLFRVSLSKASLGASTAPEKPRRWTVDSAGWSQESQTQRETLKRWDRKVSENHDGHVMVPNCRKHVMHMVWKWPWPWVSLAGSSCSQRCVVRGENWENWLILVVPWFQSVVSSQQAMAFWIPYRGLFHMGRFRNGESTGHGFPPKKP